MFFYIEIRPRFHLLSIIEMESDMKTRKRIGWANKRSLHANASDPDIEFHEFVPALAKHPNVSPELLTELYHLLRSADWGKEAALAVLTIARANKNLIAEILKDFPDVVSEDSYSCGPEETSYPVLLAKNPSTPRRIVGQLVGSPFYMVRERVASRSDLSQSVMKKLAHDKNRHVRQCLAGNPGVPSSILAILAKDVEASVRFKVAVHPNASTENLSQLSADQVEEIRFAAVASDLNDVLL